MFDRRQIRALNRELRKLLVRGVEASVEANPSSGPAAVFVWLQTMAKPHPELLRFRGQLHSGHPMRAKKMPSANQNLAVGGFG